MSMKKSCPSVASGLSIDVVVKIVFYIEEWATVTAFLDALRPSQALGPLHHLHQLHLLKWSERDLWWFSLDLTKMNEASRIHVEAIAKFYSKVEVDGKTDVHWVRQYVDPNAAIYWKLSRDGNRIDPETIMPWKDLRITTIDSAIIDPCKMIETLACLNHLEVLSWEECSSTEAMAIFEYAGASSSLKCLAVTSYDDTVITPTMVDHLYKWFGSRQIRNLSVELFTWESQPLRHDFITTALGCATLNSLYIREIHENNWTFDADFDRRDSRLSFDFYDGRKYGYESLDNLIALLNPFKDSIATRVKSLTMTRFQNVDFSALWNILESALLQAKLTNLTVEFRQITSADVNLVVETIRRHTTLETLYIRCDYLPFDAVNTILEAAPSCLQRFPICAGRYNQTEMKTLQEIASKKAIVLV